MAPAPELSLRGAKRRGNLGKAVAFSPGLSCYPPRYCEIATAPLGPRNDKSVGLAPQNVCRNHRQPARRSPPAKGTLRPFFTKKFEKSRFSPCGFCLRVVYFHFVDKKSFGQHRTIAASTFAGYFSPIHRFEKLEVHKVHLHFSNLVSTKNLPPNALAESCVAALDRIQNRRDCLP